MPANIAVISDHPDHYWEWDINNSGNFARLFVGDTVYDLARRVEQAFLTEDENFIFDGTVLDIIIGNNQYGGIEIWNELAARGYRDRLGVLLVVTNISDKDSTVASFASAEARAGICYDKLVPRYRRQHLCDLFSLIPAAVKCDNHQPFVLEGVPVGPPPA